MKYALILCVLAAGALLAGCSSKMSFIVENDGPKDIVYIIENVSSKEPYLAPEVIDSGMVWNKMDKRVWYKIRPDNYVVLVYKGVRIARIALPTFKMDTYRLVVEYQDGSPRSVSEHGPMVGPGK